MASGSGASENPFVGWVVGLIVGLSGLAFLILIILTAWSPELQNRDRAGLHPYSSSALGYQGLYRLLEARGTPVTISRSRQRLETDYEALRVLTLAPFGMTPDLEEIMDNGLYGPALIVLPKWDGYTDVTRPSWFRDSNLLPEETVSRLVSIFDSDGEVWRIRAPAGVSGDFGKFKPSLGDDMQVLRADSFITVVGTSAGDLISRFPDRDVYILSDPDLLNTFGLSEAENARMALALVDHINYGADAPVLLDATLHGFERSENLLQMMFDRPFLGATLIGFAAFLMIGWAGAVRFGSPAQEGRSLALGKQALTDNTAGLIAMARRETHLAPGYLNFIRRAAARAVGAPRNLTEPELAEMFDRMTPKEQASFTTLEKDMHGPAASRDDLMNKARRLWAWHKEITHGHQ
ncbi:MAG: hypothetical protein AAF216_13235 [Pseudomonadota bacterium]